MTHFNPPIESRDTDDLILISKSSTVEWQQEAIDIAKEMPVFATPLFEDEQPG